MNAASKINIKFFIGDSIRSNCDFFHIIYYAISLFGNSSSASEITHIPICYSFICFTTPVKNTARKNTIAFLYLLAQYFQHQPLEQPQLAPELNATMNSNANAIRKTDCLILRDRQIEFFWNDKKNVTANNELANWWKTLVAILYLYSSCWTRNSRKNILLSEVYTHFLAIHLAHIISIIQI